MHLLCGFGIFFSLQQVLKDKESVLSVAHVQMWCSVVLLKNTSTLRDVTCFITNIVHTLHEICGITPPLSDADCKSWESLSNVLDSNFHWRGLIFWNCLLPWFLLLTLVFVTCCTLSWALGRLTAVSLCVQTSIMVRVCWHNSNNFRVLADVVYSKGFAITTQFCKCLEADNLRS